MTALRQRRAGIVRPSTAASVAAPRLVAQAQREAAARSDFARAVRAGLSRQPKQLPCKYFYDAVGSELFEAITALPEYGLAAADRRILARHAPALASAFCATTRLAGGSPLLVAELGSGSGRKTRLLLRELCRRRRVSYCPIEISAGALRRCRAALSGLDGLAWMPFESDYLEGLSELSRQRRGTYAGQPLLVLFLGSSYGNFDGAEGPEFLRKLRRELRGGDGLLLGVDLVKPAPLLLRAYNDSAGVTAAFNLNLLARANRELGADFSLNRFRHEISYDAGTRSVSMHLRSLARQTVEFAGSGLRVEFLRGERILTETCRKFLPEDLPLLAARTGFRIALQYIDRAWPFAESLLIAE